MLGHVSVRGKEPGDGSSITHPSGPGGSAKGASGRVPPYDGPALADYRAALGRYQPGAVKGDMGSGAWVVGKFVEKIGAGLDNDPTSAELIEALYGVKGETLGGLLPGITFPRDKDRSNVNLCAIPARFTAGKFVPHDPGATFVCAPGQS